jgi:hypothetical protein
MTPPTFCAQQTNRTLLKLARLGWVGLAVSVLRAGKKGGYLPGSLVIVTSHCVYLFFLFFSFSLLCVIISVNHVFPSCPNIWPPNPPLLVYCTLTKMDKRTFFFTPFLPVFLIYFFPRQLFMIPSPSLMYPMRPFRLPCSRMK